MTSLTPISEKSLIGGITTYFIGDIPKSSGGARYFNIYNNRIILHQFSNYNCQETRDKRIKLLHNQPLHTFIQSIIQMQLYTKK